MTRSKVNLKDEKIKSWKIGYNHGGLFEKVPRAISVGLPVSVLIDVLYRQIIMTGSVPFPLAVPKLPSRESLTDGEFNAIMEKGCEQAKSGDGLPAAEAFAGIREKI